MKKHVVIVSNGTLQESFLPVIRQADLIIGVDRAAYWLLQNDIVPDIAVGDFDSVTPEEFQTIEKKC